MTMNKRSSTCGLRIDSMLSKNIQNNFQNLLFKKLVAHFGDQTDKSWEFYSPADTLCSSKTVRRVFSYTTAFPGNLFLLLFSEAAVCKCFSRCY